MSQPPHHANHPNADVRMRGFRTRSSVDEVWHWLDDTCSILGSERVGLAAAHGRMLGCAVVAEVDVPQFARAMMDGYAVLASDTHGASSYNRLQLQVVDQSLPGYPAQRELRPGEAIRIMTGAPMPRGADAVVPAEWTEATGESVTLLGAVAEQKNVGQRGEDVQAGATVFQPPRLLRPQDVGLLSSIGISQVPVIRKPRVLILITGDELLPAGSPPRDYRIADANGPMLAAMVARDGGDTIALQMIPDDPDRITEALQQPFDVCLVSGGSSVGQEDHAPRIVDQLGRLQFHGIAMRPSSPAGLGQIDDRLICLLPGNPVSCLAAYDFFAGRAIRHLGGRDRQLPYAVANLTLKRKITSHLGRTDYTRVRIAEDGVEPIAISGASILSSTSLADGFVIVPENSEGFAAGMNVSVYQYDSPPSGGGVGASDLTDGHGG